MDVTQIFSSFAAFAALRADGSVVTWGAPYDGGDSSAVAGQLNGTLDVTQIFSTGNAFAALRVDGSVVTWGRADYGGDSSAVASQLDGTVDVTQIVSTNMGAFAALHADGSVVTWGRIWRDSPVVTPVQLDGTLDITQIFSTDYAFAGLCADGSVVTWGWPQGQGQASYGGNMSGVAGQLDGSLDVTQVFSTNFAFAALRVDGSVVTWGDAYSGGDSSAVASQLDGTLDVTQIFSTSYGAFAALRVDGSVVTWGHTNDGGDSSAVASQLDGTLDVTQIFSTGIAFAALRADGSVVTWGDADNGGDSSAVASQLDGTLDVTQIFSTNQAFAALRVDGSVVTWGDTDYGGDSSAVAGQLDGTLDVTQIFSTQTIFAALRVDGSVVTWGMADNGGDSSAVASQLTNVVGMANPFTDDRFSASSVNTPPAASNRSVTINENIAKVLSVADFGFSDVNPGDTLKSVTIISLPTAGSLKLNGVAVTAKQVISAANIYSDLLIFTPAANANGTAYASFGFKVSDGTALSASAYTMNMVVDGLGTSGNDTLIGGLGNDTMAGGLGNDTYVVNTQLDIVIELAGQGTDLIQSSSTYSLVDTDGAGTNGGNVENLRLTGTAAINATGNALNNTLYANGANNTLNGGSTLATDIDTVSYRYGLAAGAKTGVTVSLLGSGTVQNTVNSGSDTLINIENLTGSNLNDKLTGNNGKNVLNGGLGNDTLTGGAGNDIYVIDNPADVVIEVAGYGTADQVKAACNYILADNGIENLLLTGTAAINGTGNSLGNIITGNSAANVLKGGAGADTLSGGLGNDTIDGGVGGDSATFAGASSGYQVSYGSGKVTVTDIDSSNGDYGSDTLTGIELLKFSDKTISGATAADIFKAHGGANLGKVGILADFSKAVYSLGNWETTGDNARINDLADSGGAVGSGRHADDVLNGLFKDWMPLSLNMSLPSKIYLKQEVVHGDGTTAGVPNVLGVSTYWPSTYHAPGVAGNYVYGTINNKFSGGLYTCGSSAALVASCTDSLVIAFRGTNDNRPMNADSGTINSLNDFSNLYRPDVGDWNAMADHYKNFSYLYTAIDNYLATHLEIKNVYVTGHSLGGAMALRFMNDHQDTTFRKFEAITFAAPAYYQIDAKPHDSRITNIEIQHDPVPKLAGAFDPQGDILYFVGDKTVTDDPNIDTDDANNHSMEYYRDISWNVDNTAWGDLLGRTGETEILLGGERSVTNHFEKFDVATKNDKTLNATVTEAQMTAGVTNFDRVIDVIYGGAGIDTMTGGDGPDTYYVQDVGDKVIETNATASIGGYDMVHSYLRAYILTANVENGRIRTVGDVDLTGNAVNNTLYAGTGNNILNGGTRNASDIDTVSYQYGVTATGVTVKLITTTTGQATGGSGADTLLNIENLTGSRYNDQLTGNTANNVLDGGAGNDKLDGGAGNDTYVVNTTADLVTERANEGIDLIKSSASYSLADTDGTGANGGNVENLQLTGTAAINATGNTLNNILYANSAGNVLDGGTGIDTVSYQYGATARVTVSLATTAPQATGGSGSDVLRNIENLTGTSNYYDILTGNSGNNVLDGGLGDDTLIGGLGNDTYVVNSQFDIVTELTGQGTDLIQSSSTYSLVDTDGIGHNGGNVENLLLIGTAAINATGNALSNILYANGANNTLNGGTTKLTDIDTVSYQYGITANLTTGVKVDLSITSAQNTVSSGSDKLINIDNLTGSNYDDTLIGNAGNNTLNGGSGKDYLNGGKASDVLIGGLGNDTLTGGDGIDYFIFNTALNATSNKDTITDFNIIDDTIRLENGIMTGLGVTAGALAAGAFHSGIVNTATQVDDRIIYNTSTGGLFYDADGTGASAAVQIAIIGTNNHAALTNADFVVI